MVFLPNPNPFFHPFPLPLSLSLVVCVSQVERCYYFLHSCVETAQRNEPVDGRLVQFLLSNPTNDGGQWDMLVNLIGQFASQISSLCVFVFYIVHWNMLLQIIFFLTVILHWSLVRRTGFWALWRLIYWQEMEADI